LIYEKIKEIRIIKKEDSKGEYTFVSKNILNNRKNEYAAIKKCP
jgi:hypothetical protein